MCVVDYVLLVKNRVIKLWKLRKEFYRYLLVGGTAFIIDASILFLSPKYIFDDFGKSGVLISTALGFIAGLIFNYILSILFVFEKSKEKVKGKQAKTFVIFAIIGIIGLILTELGMYAGLMLFGESTYIFIKIFVAGVVLLWNYTARKIIIFR